MYDFMETINQHIEENTRTMAQRQAQAARSRSEILELYAAGGLMLLMLVITAVAEAL